MYHDGHRVILDPWAKCPRRHRQSGFIKSKLFTQENALSAHRTNTCHPYGSVSSGRLSTVTQGLIGYGYLPGSFKHSALLQAFMIFKRVGEFLGFITRVRVCMHHYLTEAQPMDWEFVI